MDNELDVEGVEKSDRPRFIVLPTATWRSAWDWFLVFFVICEHPTCAPRAMRCRRPVAVGPSPPGQCAATLRLRPPQRLRPERKQADHVCGRCARAWPVCARVPFRCERPPRALCASCADSCLAVPLQICFTYQTTPFFDALDILSDTFFIFDLMLNFRTAYNNYDGTFEMSPQKIRNKYLKSWFPIDLAASIPFDRLAPGGGSGTIGLSLAKTPRLLRISRLLKKLDMLTSARAMRLVSVMIIFLVFTHFVGCFWWLVGRLMGPNGWQFQPSIVALLLQGLDWDALLQEEGSTHVLFTEPLLVTGYDHSPAWLPQRYNATAIQEVYIKRVGLFKMCTQSPHVQRESLHPIATCSFTPFSPPPAPSRAHGWQRTHTHTLYDATAWVPLRRLSRAPHASRTCTQVPDIDVLGDDDGDEVAVAASGLDGGAGVWLRRGHLRGHHVRLLPGKRDDDDPGDNRRSSCGLIGDSNHPPPVG